MREILYFKSEVESHGKSQSESCSSRVVVTDDANNIDVEQIDIERSNTSEGTVAEENGDLLAVRTKRTEKDIKLSQQKNF